MPEQKKLGLLAQAGVAFGELDAVAATEGPGLLGSLLVGHGTRYAPGVDEFFSLTQSMADSAGNCAVVSAAIWMVLSAATCAVVSAATVAEPKA